MGWQEVATAVVVFAAFASVVGKLTGGVFRRAKKGASEAGCHGCNSCDGPTVDAKRL